MLKGLLLFKSSVSPLNTPKLNQPSLIMLNKSSYHDFFNTDSNLYFEQVLNDSNHCLWKIDAKGMFFSISKNIARLSGFKQPELLARRFIDFLPKTEQAIFLEHFNQQQKILKLPIHFLHKQQQDLVFEMSALPVIKEGTFFGYYGLCINITEYALTEEKLSQSETNLADAQRIAHLGSWELDLISNELFWSDEIYRIIGKDPETTNPKYEDFIKVIHPDDLDMVTEKMDAAIETKTYDIQHRVIQENGETGILHERGEVIFDDKGTPIRMIGTTQNITALKEAEDKIVQLENYDFLTELPNRAMFSKLCNQMLISEKQHNHHCALLCMGIDRFKLINESMGHDAGNALLQAVAQRLRKYLHSDYILARLGGDEFALALTNVTHADIAALTAQEIINDFTAAFTIQDQDIVIGLSIGITLCPIDNRLANDLLKDAQTAMHRAKSADGNNYQFYSTKMTDAVKYRLGLESHLRRALEQNEFLLYYQPKVSTKTGKITGAEALIRWQHPERGLISPLDFVPVLEDTGLIIPVGEWTLQKICQQYHDWYELGFGDLSLALNLSVKQFSDTELYEKVKHTLAQFKHGTDFLELEVTESILMGDLETATHTLKALHSLGIKLSIDDFGTGYSSLAYLKLMPVDTLKIDRSFVIGLPDDEQDSAIVRVIIMLAQALNLKVVAEGVETIGQLNFLTAENCDYIQGYYYSKPIPADEFTRLLQKDRE